MTWEVVYTALNFHLQTGTCTVTIDVTNVNDNQPLFNQPNGYVYSIPENQISDLLPAVTVRLSFFIV